MRNKIFGVIGMVWGGLIVLRILLNLSALDGSAYSGGTVVAGGLGALMFGAGLHAFLKKPGDFKSTKAQKKDGRRQE